MARRRGKRWGAVRSYDTRRRPGSCGGFMRGRGRAASEGSRMHASRNDCISNYASYNQKRGERVANMKFAAVRAHAGGMAWQRKAAGGRGWGGKAIRPADSPGDPADCSRRNLDSRQLAAKHQITAPQLVSLMAIVEMEPTTAIEVARRVYLGASTMVGVTDRLEAKGLIQRERDSKDRRQSGSG